MVNHVRSLVDKAVVSTIGSLDDGLNSLFAHLLCHAVDASLEERCGVRPLGHLGIALGNEVLQVAEEHDGLVVHITPAGVSACMAHGAHGIDHDEQRVAVAILLDGNHVEEVSALFALRPQAVLGTAEEGHFTRLHRLVQSLLVHEAQHQHLLGVVILNDGRNKSAHFIEIQFHIYFLYLMLLVS